VLHYLMFSIVRRLKRLRRLTRGREDIGREVGREGGRSKGKGKASDKEKGKGKWKGRGTGRGRGRRVAYNVTLHRLVVSHAISGRFWPTC
jgi:hypothetical protein